LSKRANKAEHFKRIPKHIGIIPDGNRRWAVDHNMEKQQGYGHGIEPGFQLYRQLLDYGIEEVTFYGFTKDNTKRPAIQTEAYVKACVDAVKLLSERDANLLVVGKTDSRVFPDELKKYANQRVNFGKGSININFLVNYDWEWDLKGGVTGDIHSKDISRIDLILRWGGRRRLSGFLPVQSVYADFYVLEENWPDFKTEHFINAMKWYQQCDVTLGG